VHRGPSQIDAVVMLIESSSVAKLLTGVPCEDFKAGKRCKSLHGERG